MRATVVAELLALLRGSDAASLRVILAREGRLGLEDALRELDRRAARFGATDEERRLSVGALLATGGLQGSDRR